MSSSTALWIMDISEGTPAFLPADLDRTKLIDITRSDDLFKRYLDENSGVVHDGAEYHRMSQERWRIELPQENKDMKD